MVAGSERLLFVRKLPIARICLTLFYNNCFRESHQTARMYLMYYMSVEGKRVYTLAKVDPEGKPTFSAHPAR